MLFEGGNLDLGREASPFKFGDWWTISLSLFPPLTNPPPKRQSRFYVGNPLGLFRVIVFFLVFFCNLWVFCNPFVCSLKGSFDPERCFLLQPEGFCLQPKDLFLQPKYFVLQSRCAFESTRLKRNILEVFTILILWQNKYVYVFWWYLIWGYQFWHFNNYYSKLIEQVGSGSTIRLLARYFARHQLYAIRS